MALGCMASVTSCENGDVEFPDFDYQTVYFANQTPVRTITLGDDVYPTDLDNKHICQIYATMGGVNANKTDRKLQIAVDETLCSGKQFADGRDILPLPSSYYTLSGNTITISSGKIMGAVDVQLTDAFFADPLTTEVNYVLPLRIVSASDSILSGKDYTLYALKYKNKYHGCWLSMGRDVVSTDGKEDKLIVREPEYWEKADLVYLSTKGLQQSRYNVSVDVTYLDNSGKEKVKTMTCTLILTFDDADRCTITTDTKGCTASGSGQWTWQGAKKAWGDKDRDQLVLDYEVTFSYESAGQPVTTKRATKETLVMRDRQSLFEEFQVK